ncbi:Lrp/AsnC family transcriptional regulator [Cellulophaga sp. Hel_I_12]|uniref:Lrp/AsnC family transcriptional regulator n=1 Tax=Cellulophaga sp. Hel_I_12 TaxID=1249972 RepID=UPI0006462B5F|nr:Lrp/AsnC family transcriptional regulator [Cellulophaga sp. Hel_I_12]
MLSTIDIQIIKILKKNSRASFAEIGRKIALSPSSVRERIQKLEDLGVIKSYSIKLNHAMMGNGLEVFIMLKIFDGKLQYILSEITTYPEVLEVFRITGPYNIHMRVALRDQLHLQQFVDKLIKYGSPTTHLILSELKNEEEL